MGQPRQTVSNLNPSTSSEGVRVAVARVYRMSCLPGKAEELRKALEALAGMLKGLEGLRRVSILRDAEQPDDFLFVEKWDTVAQQEVSGKMISKDAFARVMAGLGGGARGSVFCVVLE